VTAAAALPPALDAPGVALTVEGLRALRGLVHPRPEAPRGAIAQPGQVVSRRRGRGMEPLDIRPFVTGDDPRRIDRHATARTGKPQVREVHDERALSTLLICDLRPCMFWGTRGRLRAVAAAEALTLLGWRRAAQGARIALLALTADGPVASRARVAERGVEAAIGALTAAHARALAAAARGAPDQPLTAALADARALAPRGGEIAVASCFEATGGGLSDLLGELAARGRLRPILITDAFEAAPPRGIYPVARADGASFWARFGARAADAADPRRAALRPFGAATVDAGAPPDAATAALEALE
jgi:uncharacterized protein (DUF58 family)